MPGHSEGLIYQFQPPTQAEEEEYTQQIIDYFNAGLVPLPEGVTLRAYLAEKLNWYVWVGFE